MANQECSTEYDNVCEDVQEEQCRIVNDRNCKTEVDKVCEAGSREECRTKSSITRRTVQNRQRGKVNE